MRQVRLWAAVAAVGVFGSLAAVSAVAGGLGGADAPARVPVPARDFSASVSDKAGVEIDLTRVTFNGEVFFYGVLGEGSVTIPFEKVDVIRIEPSEAVGKVVLFASLRDGQTTRILVEDDMPFYGVAAFGNYRIEARHVQSIRVSPTP